MNIGDLFLRIVADDEGFAADLIKKVEKAGDAAGTTLGQKLGNAVKKNGAAIIGSAFTAGIGIAAKGMLELQNITADFRAETGATAEEADRAGKAINAMSGKNIQPVQEIGAALTKVHTELHQTGAEAEKTTQQFLTFGRVTKVNAATEVEVFHRILAAWNLTADKTGAIMDALVLSHQRFGGVISEDEAALQALAPALLAANQTWQDGLALINLFKESGVDATVAVTAMTKALGHVKSPEELRKLIADISATVDPFERAKLAIALFGAKAGAKLADVLRPGMGGLADYSVSATDAAGATQAAADVLDSTFGARFQLLLKSAGSAIIGFGNDWSGAAQVAGTAAAAFGALGGARLVGPLTGALKGAWTKVGSSSVVTKAVAFASGKAATIYIAALIAGDAIGAALTTAWNATGGRIAAAAGIQGATAGRAFAVAAGAAIVAAPLAVLAVALQIKSQIDTQGNDLKAQTDAWLKTLPSDADLQNSIKGITEQLNQIPANAFGARTITVEVLNKLIAESNRRAGQMNTSMTGMAGTGVASFTKIESASTRARAEMVVNARRVAAAIVSLTTTLVAQAQKLIAGYYDPIIAADDLRVQKDTIASDKLTFNADQVALRKAKAAAATAADAVAKAATESAAVQKVAAARKKAADDAVVAAQLTVDQSKLALDQSMSALDQTRLTLLATGALSVKDQKVWLTELQAKYKTATGSAKTEIQKLIDKIHELQKIPSTAVTITVGPKPPPSKHNTNPIPGAEGGPAYPGQLRLVGELGPELFVPKVTGTLIPSDISMAMLRGTAASGPTFQTTINYPDPSRGPEDFGRTLRRLTSLGIVG